MRWRWPPESVRPCSPTIGVVAVREPDDELVRLDRACGRLDVGVARVGPCERDVVADRVREEEGVLEHDTDLLAQ